MGIILRELIRNPGRTLPFAWELSTERLDFPQLVRFDAPPAGEGVITNEAGALTLRGELRADMRCVCDRCTSEFDMRLRLPLEVPLATELEDEEDPDSSSASTPRSSAGRTARVFVPAAAPISTTAPANAGRNGIRDWLFWNSCWMINKK